MEPRVLSIEEAAEGAKVSAFTIRRAVKSKRLKAIRIGRRVLIPIPEFERLMREGLLPRPTSR